VTKDRCGGKRHHAGANNVIRSQGLDKEQPYELCSLTVPQREQMKELSHLSNRFLKVELLCFQTRNSRKAKIMAKIKVKNVSGRDDTVEEFVTTVLT
jgi:hypothetical protein